MAFHRLGKGAHGPALVLCALAAVLWAGSYLAAVQFKLPVTQGSTRWSVTSCRGIVSISLIHGYPLSQPGDAWVHRTDADDAARWDAQYRAASVAGFSVEDAHVWIRDGEDEMVVRRWNSLNLPYWLLFAAAAAAPLHALYVLVRARRRNAHNCCGVCGYALGDGATCQACAARAVLIGGASSRVRLIHPAM